MNCLIILTLAIAAQAQIFPQDTPEVAAAKAAHFAEHAKAAAAVGAPLQDVYRSVVVAPFAAHFAPAHHFASHHFAPAPIVSPEGYLVDTPEVAAARAAHLAEHARAAAATQAVTHFASDPYTEYYRAYHNYINPSHSHSGYQGPQAVPVVLPSGYLADTPEVAHARAVHLYRHYQEATRQ